MALVTDLDDATAARLLANDGDISHYLYSVFSLAKGSDETPPSRSRWDLIWVARDIHSGGVGGAAGQQSFVANYLSEDGKPTAVALTKLLPISAHESVHAITPLDMPSWAAKSLPEYYAFKSMAVLGLDDDNPKASWQR